MKDHHEAYDKYWDAVRVERTLMSQSEKKGREEGREEERMRAHQEKINMAKKFLALGVEKQQITEVTGLSLEEIA